MPKMDPKRGEYIARSFVCPAGILEDCEESFVLRTRAKTGWKANRSRLIQALMNIAGSSAGKFDPRCVVDQNSFEKALRQAINASSAYAPRKHRG